MHYTRIYILRTKDDTLDAYCDFAAWAQMQHGVKIKALRSDRGGEHTGRAFTQFLREQGTERRLTTHNTPQHNGIAESLNRRLLERVRAILHHSGLPKNLWAEALHFAIWLKNRTSTRALGNSTTPLEKLTGTKLNLLGVPKWGQTIWVHSGTGSKLDACGVEARWVGYDLDSPTHTAFTGRTKTLSRSNATSSSQLRLLVSTHQYSVSSCRHPLYRPQHHPRRHQLFRPPRLLR